MNTPHSKTDLMTMAGLNLIQQALSIYDSDLRLVVCNRPFRAMFNLPDALVTPGASFQDTIRYLVIRGEYGPQEDLEQAVLTRVDQARAFAAHYMERTRPDGRTIAVEGSPLPQGGWVTVYTDISGTKRQEALLRARSEELSDQLLAHAEELSATNRQLAATVTMLEETKRQLTEIEARTRLTTEMMPAHIAHVGRDRVYTYSNRRLSAVMPNRPSNIIGLHIRDALGAEAHAAIADNLEAAFEGRASVFEFTYTPGFRRIRVAFTPDSNADEVNGVYILSMDVTEETQARAALQQTRRREIAAQLTSGLAHDFANLLTIILGMQSRLTRMDLPEAADALITATLAAAKRGGGLLNRIADLTSAREMHAAATDVAALLRDFSTLAGSALPDAIALNISNTMPNTPVMLDPGMLQDSLLNLVLNARDAIGAVGQIDLLASISHNWIEFTVTDTGPGFSAHALDHALEPFFTTKGGEGSGLGLSMVYDMAKLAGGRVQLANTATGAQVTLRLPLRPAAPIATHGLVLLVEDSPDLRASVRDMLTDLGHSVIEAASVDEALILLGELPEISLILSDISLEGSATGIDLLHRLPSPHCPCVLMTSLPTDHLLYRQGAALAPVLRKPFSASQLAAQLYQETPP